MACIQINKDYRISSDRYCWRVEKYSGIDKKSGEQKWAAQTYHGTLQQAANSLGSRLLRDSDAQTLGELIKAAEIARTELEKALKEEA